MGASPGSLSNRSGTRLQPLPDIRESIELLNKSSFKEELSLSHDQYNINAGRVRGGSAGSGDSSHSNVVTVRGEGQGRTPRGNVLHQQYKGSDKSDQDHKKNHSHAHHSEKSSNGLRGSKKVGSGHNDKVGALHLLVVDDSGMSRKMLSRVSNIRSDINISSIITISSIINICYNTPN